MKRVFVSLVLALSFSSCFLSADYYYYQDADGCWNYDLPCRCSNTGKLGSCIRGKYWDSNGDRHYGRYCYCG